MKMAFVTDSGTEKSVGELTQAEIYSVPLQISCGNKSYQDLEELGIDEIYALAKDGKVLSTSLPSLGKIEELFQGLRQQGCGMMFTIPIYSGLSGTINAMEITAQQQGIAFDYVDCHVAAVVQECMIRLAGQLHETGKSIEQIKGMLQHIIHTTSTMLLPSDSQHLKRGGQLTPLAVTLGDLLKIKPILKINEETDGKIGVLDKVRTVHKTMDRVIEIMKHEHVDDSYLITVAHTDDEAEVLMYMNKLRQAFPNVTHQIIRLVSVVGIHTKRGCQAVQYFKQIRE